MWWWWWWWSGGGASGSGWVFRSCDSSQTWSWLTRPKIPLCLRVWYRSWRFLCDDPQRNRPTCSKEPNKRARCNWVRGRPPYGTRCRHVWARRNMTTCRVQSTSSNNRWSRPGPRVTPVERAAILTSHTILHSDTTYHISLNPNISGLEHFVFHNINSNLN